MQGVRAVHVASMIMSTDQVVSASSCTTLLLLQRTASEDSSTSASKPAMLRLVVELISLAQLLTSTEIPQFPSQGS